MKKFKIQYVDKEKRWEIEDIKEISKKSGIVYKDNQRSYVKKVEFNGEKIIFKSPTEKNNSNWIRFLTLFRKSEVQVALESMLILNENGIYTNEPIAFAEKRKYGMVVDSFMVYKYLNGDGITKDDAESTLNCLKKIHKLGYLHDDPQINNFLKYENNIYVIDAKLKRKKYGKISENMEYIRLAVGIENVHNYIDKKTIYYKIANFFHNLLKLKRKVRRKMKK